MMRVVKTLDGGEIYRGDVHALTGIPHGKGHVKYPCGYNFSGDFICGQAICGIVTSKLNEPLTGYNSSVPYLGRGFFSGEYEAGVREGYGVETLADGRTYEGWYSGDKSDGIFIYTNAEHKQFEQVWAQGSKKSEKIAGEVELQAVTKRRQIDAQMSDIQLKLTDNNVNVNCGQVQKMQNQPEPRKEQNRNKTENNEAYEMTWIKSENERLLMQIKQISAEIDNEKVKSVVLEQKNEEIVLNFQRKVDYLVNQLQVERENAKLLQIQLNQANDRIQQLIQKDCSVREQDK